MLFEGLTRIDANGKTSLAQAESVAISEDRTKYVFTLRPTLWSDGTPVTAWDFENSWKDILSPSFPSFNAHLFYPIKNAELAKTGKASLEEVGIKAQDAKTLVVELHHPAPYFLELVAFCAFFPVPRDADKHFSEWALHGGPSFVCNGPFCLNRWKHDQEIQLKKNGQYREVNKVRLDTIRVSMVKNETSTLHLYANDQLDMIDISLSPLPLETIANLKKSGELFIRPVAGIALCVFNTEKFPFHNMHMRKAFSLAIDRIALVNHVTQMEEQAAFGLVPPLLTGRQRSFIPKSAIDEAKACFKQALCELGLAKEDLKNIEYSYCPSPLNHKIAQTLQQKWKEVLGIEIQLRPSAQKNLLSHLSKRDFTFAQSSWYAQYHDPMNILERFITTSSAKNYTGWGNQKFSALLEASSFAEGEKRLDLLEEAEQIVMDEMPVAPLYHCSSGHLLKPHLKNTSLCKMGDINFRELYIDKEH